MREDRKGEKLSLDAETHSKGFFSSAEFNISQAYQEMNKYQKNSQVSLNPPRLNKTWLKDEAKRMNPLEPKCPTGLCTFKPRISLPLHPCCCTALDYWWERWWSDVAVHCFHPPCYAPAGKTAGIHLFIISSNQIFPTSGKNAAGNLFSSRDCQGDLVKLKKNSHTL